MSLSLSMHFSFKTTIEKLCSAVTDSSKLARWISENDFHPSPAAEEVGP